LPVEIDLSDDQMYIAAHAGTDWRLRSIAERRRTVRPLGPHNRGAFEGDIAGAIGEMAVAQWLGIPWNGGDAEFLAAPRGRPPSDVGGHEVRATWYGTGSLILEKKDLPKGNSWFILCTLEALPIVRLRGCILGRRGMIDRLWKPPPEGKWWVPQNELHPCPERPRQRVLAQT
jgi:hypothetical protein